MGGRELNTTHLYRVTVQGWEVVTLHCILIPYACICTQCIKGSGQFLKLLKCDYTFSRRFHYNSLVGELVV